MAANASKERYATHDQVAPILAEADRVDADEDGLGEDRQASLRGVGGIADEAERQARFSRAAEALDGPAQEPDAKGADAGAADAAPATNKARGRKLAAT